MSAASSLTSSGLAVLAAALAGVSDAPPLRWTQPGAEGIGGIYLKVTFDDGANPLMPAEPADVALTADPEQALVGRSLRVSGEPRGHIGAAVPLSVKGSSNLRVAFVTKAKGMREVAVNVFDERRRDNTTPASPARIFDDDWHPVVFAAEDFHYNSDPPDRKIERECDFSRLLFYGREIASQAELWLDKVVLYRGPDERSPDAPGDLRATPEADGSVVLAWQEPADNTFAVVYSVHRKSRTGKWEKIGETLRLSYHDWPRASEAWTYRVTAADYDNNVSAPSADVTITPAAAAAGSPTAIKPAQWVADRAGYAENVRQVHARGNGKVQHDVFLFTGDSITGAALYTRTLGSWLARGLTVRRGVASVRTDYGAANIQRYLGEARPEFAVVMYGTNDMGAGSSIRDGIRNLTAVVDACIEFGTVPVLTTIPPRGFDKRHQRQQEQFNLAVAELGRTKRVPVIYAFEEMMQHDLKDILRDGVHLQSGAGNEAAGRALRQTMDQVYYALRDLSGGW